MVVENRQETRQRLRLGPGRIPDPLRAHGAWVYLAVSILAGMLTVTPRGYAPAVLAGCGFVGVLVAVSSVATTGRRAGLGRLVVGSPLAIGSPLLALDLGAAPESLFVSLLAVPLALAAAYFASRQGFLSPGALAFGVTALVVSAPVAASAGGASPRSAFLILVTLAPFCFWRTWRLARELGRGWTRERLARQGLVESALAVAWAAVAVMTTRLLS
jgi:hypothetical protein